MGRTLRTFALAPLFAAVLTAGAARGEMYRWTDAEGRVHWSDAPPESVPGMTAEKERVYKDEGTPYVAPIKAAPRPAVAKERVLMHPSMQNVVVYTTSWCPTCRMAKDFLDKNHIPYTEYDVEKDRRSYEEFRKINPTGGVPFALVNGSRLLGFNYEHWWNAVTKGD